jgi:uncharacterized protein (TIGR02284 family)
MSAHDVSKLDHLIITTIDSVKGYDHAAAHAVADEHRDYFRSMADDRRVIVQALSAQSRRLGGTPADYGSTAATIHRLVESVRRVLGGGDAAILAEIEHGEAYLDEEFASTAGDGRLSPETQAVVDECRRAVHRGRVAAHALREEAREAA